MTTLIERAAASLDDDPALALQCLLESWRVSRSSAVANVIDALGARAARGRPPVPGKTIGERLKAWIERAQAFDPSDLTLLLKDFTLGKRTDAERRLSMLEKWPDDPRIATALLGTIRNPPEGYRGQESFRFWERIFERMIRLADRRTAESLAEALTVTGRSDSMFYYFRSALVPQIPRLRAVMDALPPELEDPLVETIGARLSGGARGVSTARTAAELLQAVYLDPADDAARLVYADFLQEAGDPRGEFIAVQIAAATGKATAAQKRQAATLLREHGKNWLGPIGPALQKEDLAFERGFLAACRVNVDPHLAKEVVGRPEWATVRQIDMTRWGLNPFELLGHASMRSLRSVFGLRVTELVRAGALPWEQLRLTDFRGENDAAILAKCGLRHVTDLELESAFFTDGASLAALWSSPVGASIAKFAASVNFRDMPSWIAEGLRRSETRLERWCVAERGHGWSVELSRASDGRLRRAVAEFHFYSRRSEPLSFPVEEQPLSILARYGLAGLPERSFSSLIVRAKRPIGSASQFEVFKAEIGSRVENGGAFELEAPPIAQG